MVFKEVVHISIAEPWALPAGHWGGGGGNTPRIQEWKSTKNRRLEGPIPYVLLELLLNEKLKFILTEYTKIHHSEIKH